MNRITFPPRSSGFAWRPRRPRRPRRRMRSSTGRSPSLPAAPSPRDPRRTNPAAPRVATPEPHPTPHTWLIPQQERMFCQIKKFTHGQGKKVGTPMIMWRSMPSKKIGKSIGMLIFCESNPPKKICLASFPEQRKFIPIANLPEILHIVTRRDIVFIFEMVEENIVPKNTSQFTTKCYFPPQSWLMLVIFG